MRKKPSPKATEDEPTMTREEVTAMLLARLKQSGRYTEFGSIEWCGHQLTLGEPIMPEQAKQIEDDNREYRKQQEVEN
jgi:hypothetical protein